MKMTQDVCQSCGKKIDYDYTVIVISMSCKEVLPSLLNLRAKNQMMEEIRKQPYDSKCVGIFIPKHVYPFPKYPIKLSTIRELKKDESSFKRPTHGSCCTCQTCGWNYDDCRCDVYKEPRFKVGEEAQIMWKQRTSPKDSWFCSECGALLYWGERAKDYYPLCHKCNLPKMPTKKQKIIHEKPQRLFPKLMTTVKITRVDIIEMGFKDGEFYASWDENLDLSLPQIIKDDGFGKVSDLPNYDIDDIISKESGPDKFFEYFKPLLKDGPKKFIRYYWG